MTRRLDAVLRVRRLQRDTASGELLAATAAAERARAAADAAVSGAASVTIPDLLSTTELLAVHQLGCRHAAAVTAADAALRDARDQEHVRRSAVVAADRRLSAVERWDARLRATVAAEWLKTEQREVDDISGARHRRRHDVMADDPDRRTP